MIHCLIGKHKTHVAINGDGSLAHGIQTQAKIGRENIYSISIAMGNDAFCLLDTSCMIGNADIGRSVGKADKLATLRCIGMVNHNNRNLAYNLIVVNPRVEQRICQGYKDEENEYSFIAHHITHLFKPYPADVLYVLPYRLENVRVFMEYIRRFSLQGATLEV